MSCEPQDHIVQLVPYQAGLPVELVARRYELAFRVLKSGRTPAYFLGVVLAVLFAIRNRRWLYGESPHRAWIAVMVGGLGAGIGGMLANDSGPILLVNSVVALATAGPVNSLQQPEEKNEDIDKAKASLLKGQFDDAFKSLQEAKKKKPEGWKAAGKRKTRKKAEKRRAHESESHS